MEEGEGGEGGGRWKEGGGRWRKEGGVRGRTIATGTGTCVYITIGVIFLPNSNCAFWCPPSSGSLLKN